MKIWKYENKKINKNKKWENKKENEEKKRKNNIRYNQFFFQSYPHPMILWLTVLYSPEDGARWLPCYLDLKTNIGKK